jgi:uncharacterized protein YdaT
MTQQHVVRHGDGWAVRRGGSARVTQTFDTQAAATARAREIAIGQGAELMIHGRDNLIREHRSYGNDPCPPVDND